MIIDHIYFYFTPSDVIVDLLSPRTSMLTRQLKSSPLRILLKSGKKIMLKIMKKKSPRVMGYLWTNMVSNWHLCMRKRAEIGYLLSKYQ